jgi:hypothetical protein
LADKVSIAEIFEFHDKTSGWNLVFRISLVFRGRLANVPEYYFPPKRLPERPKPPERRTEGREGREERPKPPRLSCFEGLRF